MKIEELFNILTINKPSVLIKEKEDEVFDLIPELKPCKGFKQHSIWHQYDVYEHILHVVDNVDDCIELRLAALFHDLGKPETFELDNQGRGHFPGHCEVSQEIFIKFADKHKPLIALCQHFGCSLFSRSHCLKWCVISCCFVQRIGWLEILLLVEASCAGIKGKHFLAIHCALPILDAHQ